MKIKAIISDFDGTLAANQTVSQAVAQAIRQFVSDGFQFSIATGRAYAGLIEQVSHDLSLSPLQIVRGGSEIIDHTTGQVVWGKYIDPDLVVRVLAYLQTQNDIYYAAEHAEFIFTVEGKPNSEFGPQAQFKDLSDLPLIDVPKIMLPPFQSQVIIDRVLENLKQQFPELHIVKTSSKTGVGIDINDGGAGKHMAVLEYARLTNLNPQEMLGVGDSFNDYPLLTACGTKVAMGNAQDELKAIADHIVRSQAEDGMLDVLEIARSKAEK